MKMHNPKPPCNCSDCVRATEEADQRRAEIAAILTRIGATERKIAPSVPIGGYRVGEVLA